MFAKFYQNFYFIDDKISERFINEVSFFGLQ